MSTHVLQTIKLHHAIGMASTPLISVFEGAGQTFLQGAVLIGSSGLAIAASDGSHDAIIGIAHEPATGVTSKKRECIPAWPNCVFEATLEDASATDHVLVAGNVYDDFAIEVDASLRYYLNENVSNKTSVGRVIGIAEGSELGDIRARVLFTFLPTVTIWGLNDAHQVILDA